MIQPFYPFLMANALLIRVEAASAVSCQNDDLCFTEVMKDALKHDCRLPPFSSALWKFEEKDDPEAMLKLLRQTLKMNESVLAQIHGSDVDDDLIEEYWTFQQSVRSTSEALVLHLEKPDIPLLRDFVCKVREFGIAAQVFWLHERITTECIGPAMLDEVKEIYGDNENKVKYWYSHLCGQYVLVSLIFQAYHQGVVRLSNIDYQSDAPQDIMLIKKSNYAHVTNVVQKVLTCLKDMMKYVTDTLTGHSPDIENEPADCISYDA